MRDMHPAASVHASERLTARHLIQARRPPLPGDSPSFYLEKNKPSPARAPHLGESHA